jgi:hypothetical protein
MPAIDWLTSASELTPAVIRSIFDDERLHIPAHSNFDRRFLLSPLMGLWPAPGPKSARS